MAAEAKIPKKNVLFRLFQKSAFVGSEGISLHKTNKSFDIFLGVHPKAATTGSSSSMNQRIIISIGTILRGIFLLRLVLVQQSVCATATAAPVVSDTLAGYLFGCGGRVNHVQAPPYYGFVGENEVHCPDVFGTGFYPCGSYNYTRGEDFDENNNGGESSSSSSSSSSLSATLSLALNDWYNHISGTYEVLDLRFIDGVLVSYKMETGGPVGQETYNECTVLALDWKKLYQGLDSVFFWCGQQNAVPGQSYEENSFTLDSTGNFHFQSNLETLSGTGETIRHSTVRRDSHGVFFWDGDFVRLYAGPQNDEEPMTLNGTLSPAGELFIDGFSHENNFPCMAQTDVSVLPVGEDYPSNNNDDDAVSNRFGYGGYVIIDERVPGSSGPSSPSSFGNLSARMCTAALLLLVVF